MEKEFVSYEQAVALGELGFDEPCFGSYQLIETRDYKNGLEISHTIGLIVLNGLRNHNYKDEITNAPLKQQVFRWFREKYDLSSNIWSGKINHIFYGYDILHIKKQRFVVNNTELGGGDCDYDTYEEAEDACIDKLIELAKQQDN